ncbi:MAG: sigma-70 family RNA polymerase sigma factor [Planctomycetes bacterium]|nr:sigma-70 family RNA polymerase sigma factor [Planctomycetota bacterium]
MARFQRDLDTEAFQRIVSFHTGPALGVARQILSDHILAEDAVQEAFLRVVRNRHQYEPPKPFSCWFYSILRNVCIDMLRQRKRHIKAVEKIADWSAPTVVTSDRSLRFDVRELLCTLPASEQAVLNLRIVHDMAFRDIAATISISTEAAKKRAQRALRRLREKCRNCSSVREILDVHSPENKSPDLPTNVSPHKQPKRN